MTQEEQDKLDGNARLIDQYGEALDKMMSYMGELHSQMIAMSETVIGAVAPLVEENKTLRKELLKEPAK